VDSAPTPENLETAAKGEATVDATIKTPVDQLAEIIGSEEEEAKQSQGPVIGIPPSCSV